MFSGYDCDSLALEPLTKFIEYFLPVFRDNPNLLLEIRTKSTQIRTLLDKEPFGNCIVAFSFTPATIASTLEHLTPGITKRINAMVQLQKKGWSVGIRFDPLIYDENFKQNYEALFDSIFNKLNVDKIHSVSLGSFRLPKKFFKKISELYPDELLFASPFADHKGMISYRDNIRTEMIDYCVDALSAYIPEDRFFPCEDRAN